MGQTLGGGNIFSMERYQRIGPRLEELRLEEMVSRDDTLERGVIGGLIGSNLTRVEYRKLRDTKKYIRKKFKPEYDLRHTGKTVVEIIAPIKKGSLKLRQIMSGRGSRKYREFKFEDIRPVNTMWNQLGIEIDEGLLSCGMRVWKVAELCPETRQFIFRWNQGMIHGNTVIAHFGDVDRKCSFCKIRLEAEQRLIIGRELTVDEIERLVIPDENRAHIFWECITVGQSIQQIYGKVWEVNTGVTKEDFLMGRNIGTIEATVLYMAVNMIIKQKIWAYKLAGALPKVNSIAEDVKNTIRGLCRYQKWRNMVRQHVENA